MKSVYSYLRSAGREYLHGKNRSHRFRGLPQRIERAAYFQSISITRVGRLKGKVLRNRSMCFASYRITAIRARAGSSNILRTTLHSKFAPQRAQTQAVTTSSWPVRLEGRHWMVRPDRSVLPSVRRSWGRLDSKIA